jgi:hypothetical protein
MIIVKMHYLYLSLGHHLQMDVLHRTVALFFPEP